MAAGERAKKIFNPPSNMARNASFRDKKCAGNFGAVPLLRDRGGISDTDAARAGLEHRPLVAIFTKR